MTLSIFDRFITQTGSGITVPLAELTVNMTGASTGLATLWLDRDGTTPAGNPITANSDGRVQFYLEPGRYNMSASFGGDTVTYPNVLVGSEDATGIPLTIDGSTTTVGTYLNSLQRVELQRTVFVDAPPYNGDLAQAITDSTGYTTFMLGLGQYDITSLGYKLGGSTAELILNTKPHLKFIGVGMPQLADDEMSFIDNTGTTIQGAFINSASGFEMWDCGIDCGQDVVDNLAGGFYMEGLVASVQTNLELNWTQSATYHKNIQFGNVRILLTDNAVPANARHGCLIEHCDGVVHGYVECIRGYHGYVVKCKNLVRNGNVKVRGQIGDAYIFKSDSWSECTNSHGGLIIMGEAGKAATAPGLFQAATGVPFNSHSFGIVATNCHVLLLDVDPSATQDMTNINITSIEAQGLTAQGIIVPPKAKRWIIGPHNINSPTLAGIETQAGCSQIQICDGTVTNSSLHGYNLAGDIQHGNLNCRDNAGYGVFNNGTVVNPEKIQGIGNTSGLINGLYSVSSTITVAGTWSRSVALTSLYAGRIRFTGNISGGSADLLMTVTEVSYRPSTPLLFSVPTLTGSTWSTTMIIVNTDGTIVCPEGATIGTAGGNIWLTELNWDVVAGGYS